jgi:hypothetical protein
VAVIQGQEVALQFGKFGAAPVGGLLPGHHKHKAKHSKKPKAKHHKKAKTKRHKAPAQRHKKQG